MKKLICFTTLLLTFWSITKLTAQSYTPLVVDSANYIIVMDDYATLHLDDYWGYQILGDTVNDGKTYKKVYHLSFLHQGYVFSVPNPLILNGKYLQALIREENKIIYAKWPASGCSVDTTEYILYDFNINIGDTVDLCIANYVSPPPIIITDTFYVTYSSQQYKSYAFDTNLLIEGIGSNKGLLEYMGCAFKSICVNLWNYSRGPLSSCSIISNDKIEYLNKNVNIFPNPSADIINININNGIKYPISILIYDTHGKKVKQIISSTNESIVNINDLSKGIYEIIIIGDNLNFNDRFVKL